MRYIFVYLLVLFSLISCSSDDGGGAEAFDPCENFIETPEVTMTNVTVEAIDEGGQRGYIITALITNNTDSSIQGGQPFIHFFANDIPRSLSGSGICGFILAESDCEYEKYWSIEASENLDTSPTLACYYYEL